MTDERRDRAAASFPAGCGFLPAEDLEAAIAGRLSVENRTRFERHLDQGCAECITLAADIETFRRLLSMGPLDTERREEALVSEPLRSLLRRELRRRKLTRS